MMAITMGHIFISYSHKDKEYVHKLQEALQNKGFEVWIDDRIDYGTIWPQVIQDQLDASDELILVMSPRSYKSIWVQNELERARQNKIPIFPVLLEGKQWLSVQTFQYVDVRDRKLPPDDFYKRLTRFTTRNPIPSSPPPPKPSKPSSINPFVVASILGFIGLVMVSIFGLPPLLNYYHPTEDSPSAIASAPTSTNIPPTSIPATSPTQIRLTPTTVEISTSGIGNIINETINIKNNGEVSLFMNSWNIQIDRQNIFRFPNMLLAPGGIVFVHTSAGIDSSTSLHMNFPRPILSSGILISLYDATGKQRSEYQIP